MFKVGTQTQVIQRWCIDIDKTSIDDAQIITLIDVHRYCTNNNIDKTPEMGLVDILTEENIIPKGYIDLIKEIKENSEEKLTKTLEFVKFITYQISIIFENTAKEIDELNPNI
ncbi:1329_t:CDS:2 [Cetraspora pellucida]|uniref:1329_t:CDS:1 n=1 Tax=Cetraspora pellucida TaxID=1433469 RepID=A0ACA9JZD5_9GLOM|nr:1329_t:CDS:2 [Cetraspora pellucida]